MIMIINTHTPTLKLHVTNNCIQTLIYIYTIITIHTSKQTTATTFSQKSVSPKKTVITIIPMSVCCPNVTGLKMAQYRAEIYYRV